MTSLRSRLYHISCGIVGVLGGRSPFFDVARAYTHTHIREIPVRDTIRALLMHYYANEMNDDAHCTSVSGKYCDLSRGRYGHEDADDVTWSCLAT